MANKIIFENPISLPAPFKAASSSPIDPRIILNNMNWLEDSPSVTPAPPSQLPTILNGTYCAIYYGMQVYCTDSNELWMFVGNPTDDNGILTVDAKRKTNWRKLSDGKMSADDMKKYQLVKLTAAEIAALSDSNIKEAYKIIAYTGNFASATDKVQVGDVIKVYKDSSLVEVYLGSLRDTMDANGNITKVKFDDKSPSDESLNFKYILSNGTYSLTKIDISSFLREAEFQKNDFQTINGVVSLNIKSATTYDGYAVDSKVNGERIYVHPYNTGTAEKDKPETIAEAIDNVAEKVKTSEYVKKIEDKNPNGTTQSTSTTADVYTVTHDSATGDKTSTFKTVFHPLSPSTTTMYKKVGGIDVGTTAAQLAGRPISQILDDILFETIYPTVTSPSVTLTLNGFNVNTVYAVGATRPRSANNNFTTTYNFGTATITETGYTHSYAGTQHLQNIEEKYYAPGSSNPVTVTGTTFANVGKYTYTSVVRFDKGDDILDSKGNPTKKFSDNTENAVKNMGIPAFNATNRDFTSTVTLKVSLPFYSNCTRTTTTSGEASTSGLSQVSSTPTKWEPFDWDTTKVYAIHGGEVVSGTTITTRVFIDVPPGKKVTAAQFFTKATGWTTMAIASQGTVAHDGLNYTRYACANGSSLGACNVNFTIANV